jgi:hypothetical protein
MSVAATRSFAALHASQVARSGLEHTRRFSAAGESCHRDRDVSLSHHARAGREKFRK